MHDDPQIRARMILWWVVWVGILASVVASQFFVSSMPVVPAKRLSEVLWQLLAVVPLFLSIVVRWLLLPRFNNLRKAFPIFIGGLLLAEACGFLGVFLGGPYRGHLAVLSTLGVVQFIPIFLGQLLTPKSRGFIPND